MSLQLGEHFFRHEYGRLVAMLSRRVGVRHLEMVEDAVQSALLAALESWPRSCLPENPSAWLFRVAHNHLAGELRQRSRRDRLVAQRGREEAAPMAAKPLARPRFALAAARGRADTPGAMAFTLEPTAAGAALDSRVRADAVPRGRGRY